MKKILLLLILSFSVSVCFAQLSWLRLADYPGLGKGGLGAVSIGNYAYVGLGTAGNSLGRTDWYQYDPSSDTWTQMASCPSALGIYSVVSLSIAGKAYIITAALTTGLSNANWEYDPVSNTWTARANFPGVARTNCAGFVIGTKGYVGTGYGGGTTHNDFYEYDQPTNTWTAKASLPAPTRSGASAFSVGNKGYLGMGNNTNSTANFRDFYEYDPVTNAWSQKADFPLPYISNTVCYGGTSSGFALCGYYYQSPGITHNPLNTLYKYDPVLDEWSLSGTFCGLPRGYAGAFSIGNDIYICGGEQRNDANPAWYVNDLWKLSNGLTLAVVDPTGGTDFTFSPNPTEHFLYLNDELPSIKPDHVRIFDEAGKKILTLSYRNPKEGLDVSSLAEGLYFVELVTQDGKVYDSRFIKQE